MVRIKTKNLKYATKELISSVSVYLDLTEPKRNETNRNETTEIPKLFRFGRPLDHQNFCYRNQILTFGGTYY